MVGIKLGAYNDQGKPRKTRSGPVNIHALMKVYYVSVSS
jgi:hypothetical protein